MSALATSPPPAGKKRKLVPSGFASAQGLATVRAIVGFACARTAAELDLVAGVVRDGPSQVYAPVFSLHFFKRSPHHAQYTSCPSMQERNKPFFALTEQLLFEPSSPYSSHKRSCTTLGRKQMVVA